MCASQGQSRYFEPWLAELKCCSQGRIFGTNPGYGNPCAPTRVNHAISSPGWQKQNVVARAEFLAQTLATEIRMC